ncbi:MAG: hypothetical protein FWG65_06560 [Turicibacter sp.]|nr:hypothetical protein [Turicibacter sp.]
MCFLGEEDRAIHVVVAVSLSDLFEICEMRRFCMRKSDVAETSHRI